MRDAQMKEQGLNNISMMNQYPLNSRLRKEYERIKKEMVNERVKSTKERVFRDSAQYLMHGDKPTKCFFDKYKNKRETHHIQSLVGQDDIEVFEIDEIMNVAENYFKNLFSGRPVQQSVVDMFLEGISPKDCCKNLMDSLLLPISEEEIKDAIFSFKNGRTPGPDGLSIEFYKAMFSVIKGDLQKIFNAILLDHGRISAKMKAGLIKLIPKTPPFNSIGNFRPISLINSDFKIFTKILSTRLKPILKELIHETQFAQPGMNMNNMNTLIRDLVDDMNISDEDSFFVSIDFRKAFDTVSHDFLFKVFEKYGFPPQFIEVIKELYRDAGSHILINGYKSKKIKLKSGIRQGDPLSRDCFVLQLNPLLVFLNNQVMIKKYLTLSRKSFLTLAYMDDANFVTQSLSSVLSAIFYIKKFSKASGLEMNLSKTSGMFVNKRNLFNVSHLQFTNYNLGR